MATYKKVLIIFSILVLSILGLGLYIASVYEEEVKTYILSELNKNLATKVDIEDLSFSVFRKFPYASLELKNVRADEVNDKEKKEDLFKIKSIFLQFNIMDIIKKNYVLEKITVEDGYVDLKIDNQGNDNFHFWKSDTTQTESPFNVKLSQLIFENISVSLTNEFKKIDLLVLVDKISLSGNISEKEFVMTTQAKLNLQQLNKNNQNLLKNKKIKLSTSLTINQENKIYSIQNGKITIADLGLNLTGKITEKPNSLYVDLISTGDNLSIESIFSLLPPQQQSKLKTYKANGKITFSSLVKGNYSFTQSPDFSASFKISRGQITESSSEITLNELSLEGKYQNSKKKQSKLELTNVSAQFGAGHISGTFIITDFKNPFIELKSAADLDISLAKNFFKIDTLELASGQLKADIQYSGYIKDLQNVSTRDLQNLSASGHISFNNAQLKLINYPYQLNELNGNFQFNNNEIIIDELKTSLNNSIFSVSGSFKNLLAYLFSENQKLLVNAKLHSQKIILDELLINNKDTTKYELVLPENISFQLNTKIDTFQFRKFEAKDFSSDIILHNKIFTANQILFKSMKGKVNGDLVVNATQPEIVITSNCNVESINIHELFYQLENFGQNYFIAENIKGNLTSTIQFASAWDKNLNMNKNKLIVSSDFTVFKGELIKYQPAQALSKFIAMEELEHIRFSELKTTLEIKNQTIFIPKTEIKSSALDLTISGTHTFNNEIDYRFKLLMNDILWKKAKSKKKENAEFGYVEDDGLGKAVLYLKMTGTVSNPKISYDTKSLKEKWSADFKEEKRTIKQLLKEEFGMFKNDTTLNNSKKQKKDGFLIEWEEDTRKAPETNEGNTNKSDNTQKKGIGKIIDKIAKPNESEYEENDDF